MTITLGSKWRFTDYGISFCALRQLQWAPTDIWEVVEVTPYGVACTVIKGSPVNMRDGRGIVWGYYPKNFLKYMRPSIPSTTAEFQQDIEAELAAHV